MKITFAIEAESVKDLRDQLAVAYGDFLNFGLAMTNGKLAMTPGTPPEHVPGRFVEVPPMPYGSVAPPTEPSSACAAPGDLTPASSSGAGLVIVTSVPAARMAPSAADEDAQTPARQWPSIVEAATGMDQPTPPISDEMSPKKRRGRPPGPPKPESEEPKRPQGRPRSDDSIPGNESGVSKARGLSKALQADDSDAPKITDDAIIAAITKVHEAKGIDAARESLTRFGVAKARELKEHQRADFLAVCDGILSGEAADGQA